MGVAHQSSACMAKHPKARRKMGRYIRGNIDDVLPLATLAPKDVIAIAFDGVVNERTLVSSIVATWSLAGYTPVTDAGPIQFGVAHGDYTSAEIEESLEDVGTWDEGNLIARERGKRKIRQIGVLQAPDSAAGSFVFNDGRPKKTKLNWILNQGQALNMWAYNTGSIAVSGASGADVRATGHANLWPK